MKNTENAERAMSSSVYSPSPALPFALVRETGTNTVQLSDQGFQDRHGAI
jgi:hypothetical protein